MESPIELAAEKNLICVNESLSTIYLFIHAFEILYFCLYIATWVSYRLVFRTCVSPIELAAEKIIICLNRSLDYLPFLSCLSSFVLLPVYTLGIILVSCFERRWCGNTRVETGNPTKQ